MARTRSWRPRLVLGSAIDLHHKYWWCIVGFLAVFQLNQSDRIPQGMRPAFVSLAAATFSVTAGVVREIFEYVTDLIAPPLPMQPGETGVHDTMNELVVTPWARLSWP